MMDTRTYERVMPENTERIFVHVDQSGYIRMTADNLHQVLTHIGFEQTDKEHT